MPWDPCRDAWLAGFADGEASFNLAAVGRPTVGGRRRIQPRFDIHLRPDDAAVLRSLCERFGGRTRLTSNGPHDRFVWCVASKADLLKLVTYFDHFPLRAKKARDYAIWREAVFLYTRSRYAADNFEEMLGLKRALEQGRAYDREATISILRRVV